MERFAFLFHPLQHTDFARKFPILMRLPSSWVEGGMKYLPPLHISHVTGARSLTGVELEGDFVGLGMTPRVLLESDFEHFVLPRLIRAGQLAERLGARILGLGAFTKIVGDRGVSVAKALNIPVTTGNSYTAASAVEGALKAVDRMQKDRANVEAAVIGATGSIGRAVSHLLAEQVGALTLVARGEERLEALASALGGHGALIRTSTDPRSAARSADLVLTVSSATGVLVEPEDFRPGAVVCDVARPRNVSAAVYQHRDDVLVLDGGVIRVPGAVDFGFSFGFPPQMAEACMAETMILAMEGRYESFTLGADIEVEKVRLIQALAAKHGFTVEGFRRFERAIADQEVEEIRQRASRAGH